MAYSLKGKRVWVAGHNGMVGSALVRRLQKENCTVLTASHRELDICRQADVEAYVEKVKPQAIMLAAAKVGGIMANNSYPADFLYDNISIAANVIEAARRSKVEKLLNLGSTCIYPRLAPQPMPESALLTGPLEPTNEWYAIAKISAIKLCDAYRRQHGCDFISGMPTNLYGPNDNFDLQGSHVLPALIAKFDAAKKAGRDEVVLWGTGKPLREFLHVDDCADACVYLMENFSGEGPVNMGTGEEISIKGLAELVAKTVGYQGRVTFDANYPDGSPRKLGDVSRLKAIGWTAKIPLAKGVAETYAWYKSNAATARGAATVS